MITTITPNPALDISGTVDELVPNEKSYVRDEVHMAGGNGINAAIIAHRLGVPILVTGFIGGSNGEEIKALLDEVKVPHDFVPIKGRTRMNLTVSNRQTHKQTRLSFPGPLIQSKERLALETLLSKRKGLMVFGGSLPPGVQADYVAQLVKRMNKKGETCFVDMPGNLLKDIIRARPYFIKPNLIEFQDLIGRKVSTIRNILPEIRKLNKLVPLVCVSSVEGGAILVTSDKAWYGRIPKVKIMSTVGAGDSMVGAIAAMLYRNPKASVEELLRWGLAAACATLTEQGMVLGSKKSILKYYPEIVMKEI